MPVHHDEDLPVGLAILLTGMIVPALVLAVAQDIVTLYVGPLEFVLIAAAAFWLLAWVLIEYLKIDRTSFALVGVAWPWPVLFAALIGFLLLHRDEQVPQGPLADVFRFLIGGAESFFLYGALFALAAIGAVAASKAVESRAAQDARVPDGRVLATGLALLVVAAVVIAAGLNFAAANAAAVTATEPALDRHEQPALNVTLEGPPAELRLDVTAPDGSSVTRRLSRADMRHAPLQVAVPIEPDQQLGSESLPALAGQYRVRVAALSGVTVETATFTATSGPSVSLRDTQVSSGTITWTDPPDRVVGSTRHDTSVGVLIENAGAFHTIVSITVGTPEDRRQVVFSNVATAPGEQLGAVISVPDHVVAAIQAETGGTATVGLYLDDPFDDPIATVEIELPPA